MYIVEGPEFIKVYGPGVNPGILPRFNGEIFVDTKDAGKGECTIKIQGPKGSVGFLY